MVLGVNGERGYFLSRKYVMKRPKDKILVSTFIYLLKDDFRKYLFIFI